MKAMNYISKIVITASAVLAFISCVDLDISPQHMITEETAFETQAHVEAHLARIYSQIPMEDFRWCPRRLFNNFNATQHTSNLTGESMARDVKNAYSERQTDTEYWNSAYTLVREASEFIDLIHQQTDKFSQADLDNWAGEAHFARAFVYFALAKRYGGVPLVKEAIDYPNVSIEEMHLKRNSEEEIWDYVKDEFDVAISLLPEDAAARGRANKYAAAGIKARAMLYAGCVAKYNDAEQYLYEDNRRTCGMPRERAKDFFAEAYKAASMVQKSNKYWLYKEGWDATDKEKQYKNYVDLFFDAGSSENILVKQYLYPSSVHGYDAYNIARQFMGPDGYTSGINATLDFVEMFEIPELDRDGDGHIVTLRADGKYRLFDDILDPFKDAEPRLRGTVVFPGDVQKGEVVGIWRGIYIANETDIEPLIAAGSTSAYPSDRIIQSSNQNQTEVTLPNGEKMTPGGKSGAFSGSAYEWCFTGFAARKYIDESRSQALVREKYCDQDWIELRYAEILLARAEAAMELSDLGVTSPDGDNLATVAYTNVNEVRERGGATLLANESDVTRDIVRTEKRKEFGLENSTWWDLKRWRIFHTEQNSTQYRILMPFYAQHAEKWFFDARPDERNRTFTFDTRWYYQEIPGNEITKNPNMVQNPGY